MTGWRSYIAFLILIGMIILIDGFLWQTSDLAQWIGQLGGVSSPLDNRMEEMLGPRLIQEHLEEELDAASTPAERITALAALAKHFNKQENPDKERMVLEKILKTYGQTQQAEVFSSYLRLFTMAIDAQSDGATLRPQLEKAEALGFKTPINIRFLERVATCGTKLGDQEFEFDLLRRICRDTTLPMSQRSSVMKRFLSILAKRGTAEDLAQKALLEEALNAYERVRVAQKKIYTRAQNLLRSKNIPAAYELYNTTLEQHPDWKEELSGIFTMIRLAGVRQKSPETLQKIWPVLLVKKSGTAKMSEQSYRFMDGVLFACTQAFLQNGMEDEFLKLARAACELYTENELDMIPFMQGELWARGGRNGPPPKEYVKIPYLPEESVTIDGELDEPIYQTLTPLPGPYWRQEGYDNYSLSEAGDEKLDVRMFYTDTDLVVGVRIPEPNISTYQRFTQMKPGQTEPPLRDGADFFLEEKRVLGEIFQVACGPADEARLYHYGPGKEMYKHHMGFGKDLTENYGIDLEFPAKSQILTDSRQIIREYKIPLKVFFPDGTVPKGKLVRFNFRRISTTPSGQTLPEGLKPHNVTTISWTHMYIGIQNHQWGLLEFGE